MPTVKARLKVRIGTAAAWGIADPILLLGEPGLESDTKRLRFGDGVTAFTDLPYIQLNTTGYQALSGVLTSLAALGSGANKGVYFSAQNVLSEFDLTAVARTFLAANTQAGQRSALGLFDLSSFDPAIVRTSVEGILSAPNEDDEFPTVKAVHDLVSSYQGWTLVAEQMASATTDLGPITLENGYRYRAEARADSRNDTGGRIISFSSGAGNTTITIPLGAAGSQYAWRLEIDKRLNRQRIVVADVVYGPAPLSNSWVQATRTQHIFGVTFVEAGDPEVSGPDSMTILGANHDGSSRVSVYRRRNP